MNVHHACTDAHACTHMCTCVGVTPYPHKKFEGQILLEAEIWHIMSLDAKLQIFLSKFEVVVGGGVWHQTPPPPPPPLNFNLTLSQKKSSWSLGVVVGGGGIWTSLQPILAHSTFERMTNVCLHISCDDIIKKSSAKVSSLKLWNSKKMPKHWSLSGNHL